MDGGTPRPDRTVTPAFVESPDTVELIAPSYGEAERAVINANPEVYAGRLLSGGFMVLYQNAEAFQRDMERITPSTVGISISIVPTILGLMGREALTASGITQAQEQSTLGLSGQGVLIGLVDTGIDYTLDTFRHPDGTTRIQFLWDQTISGNPPEGFFLGTEYTGADISQALRSPQPREVVPHQDTVGHGTFLSSIMAGGEEGNLRGAAPLSELIVVKLRTASPFLREWYLVPPDQENAYSSSDLMLGIDYIVERAQQLNRPVAICIGLGGSYGSHDGYNPMDQYITRIASHTGVVISVAAGNEALARHHYRGRLPAQGSTQKVEIRCLPGASSFMTQLWNNGSDRISISVTSPTGELVGRTAARPNLKISSQLVLEKSTVSIEYYFPLPTSGTQMTLLRITDPTPGIWEVSVYGDLVIDGFFDAYLPITGFVSPGTEFLIPTPNGTVTMPGTALGVMTVGGYDSVRGSLYSESSWGPTRLLLLVPTLTAPAVAVTGRYPLGPGTMTGTSVATAITTGAAALMLEWGVVQGNQTSLNTYLTRSYFIRACMRDPGIQYPNEQWGYGRLNLYNVFLQLRGGLEPLLGAGASV